MSPSSNYPTPLSERAFGPRLGAWLGFGVFVFALLLRLVGVGWGLPNDIRNQSLHPDEPFLYFVSQRIEPSLGRFTPGFYNYGTLYLTALRVADDVARAYAPVSNAGSERGFWMSVGRSNLIGRLISCVAGAGTAWLVFAMLARVGTLWGALAGGALVAFAPGHLIHSRFQTVDATAAFLLLSGVWACVKLYSESDSKARLKYAALAGLWIGLSAGTKYSGALGLVSLAIVCAFLPPGGRMRPLLAGLVSAVAAFLISTPGAILDSASFVRDFSYEMAHAAGGHGLVFVGTSPAYLFHIGNLVEGVGALGVVIGAAGLILGCKRRAVWALALVALFVIYYFSISRAEVKFFRYVLPLIPILAIGFGYAVSEAQRAENKRWRLAVGAAIFALGGALTRATQNTLWMIGEDPRDAAARVVKADKDVKTVGLPIDPWFQTPPFYADTALPRTVPFSERQRLMLAANSPQVLRYVPSDPNERFDWDARLITELKPDAISISSFEDGEISRMRNVTNPPPELRLQLDRAEQFKAALMADYELAYRFGGDGPSIHDLMYVRPTVWIWKRKGLSKRP